MAGISALFWREKRAFPWSSSRAAVPGVPLPRAEGSADGGVPGAGQGLLGKAAGGGSAAGGSVQVLTRLCMAFWAEMCPAVWSVCVLCLALPLGLVQFCAGQGLPWARTVHTAEREASPGKSCQWNNKLSGRLRDQQSGVHQMSFSYALAGVEILHGNYTSRLWQKSAASPRHTSSAFIHKAD